MPRTPRLLRTASCVVLGLVLSCGGAHKAAPARPAPPVPPSDPWAWLPEESALVAQLVVAPFRGTPLWPIWERARHERLAISNLVDPDKIERALFGAIEGPEQAPSFVATLTGTFGPGYLDAQAKQQQAAPEPHGLLTFYRSGALAVAQVYPELIVVCSSDRVEGVAARASAGPLAKVREAQLLASLGARVNLESADFALLAEDREGNRKALAQQRAQRYGLTFSADELVRGGLSLHMGPTSQLAAVLETTGPAQAEQLRQSLDDTLAVLGGNLFVGLLGLRPLVSALATSNDGKYVAVRGSISQAELDATLERVAGMLDAAIAP